MNHVIGISLAVLLLISGSLIICWPHIKGAELEKESAAAVDSFIDAVYIPHSEVQPVESRPNEELYEAMQTYNSKIYEEKQSGLKDPWSYEMPDIKLSDFGIEEEVIGVLAIPKIELEMPVYLGASYENMAKGATVLGQTSLPIGGSNTNSVIAGHREWKGAPYFKFIDQLEPGDEIHLINLWESLTYTVTETRVIEPNDIKQILIHENKDMLTLLTCHPYGSGGRYRLLVFCERTTS